MSCRLSLPCPISGRACPPGAAEARRGRWKLPSLTPTWKSLTGFPQLPTASAAAALYSSYTTSPDTTVLTVAVADYLLHEKDLVAVFHESVAKYPSAGWGAAFVEWAEAGSREPYNSWGNDSAMRVSPLAWAFDEESLVLQHARATAEVTHNHPEGIKGGEATALSVFPG